MARLIDTSLNGPLPNDPIIGQYFDKYEQSDLDELLDDIHNQIALYLGYDPVLSVHVGEEGIVDLVLAGQYAGRYWLSLKGAPLVPGPSRNIFNYITFSYAASFVGPSQISLDFVTVNHNLSEVWTLAPGTPEGLAGDIFGGSNMSPSVTAVGYMATYAAGGATGINDPVPSGGGSGFAVSCTVSNGGLSSLTLISGGSGYTNLPIFTITSSDPQAHGAAIDAQLYNGSIINPVIITSGAGYLTPPTIGVSTATSFYAKPIRPQITAAAKLLLREAVLMEQNTQFYELANPFGGEVIGVTDGSQSVRWGRQQKNENIISSISLGYNTPLSETAERKLFPLRKRHLPITMI